MSKTLAIASRSFVATADMAANAAVIRESIASAAHAGARVLLTPECSLPGYPSAARSDLTSIDDCALSEAEDQLALFAERHHVVLVLGTVSRYGHGWSNDAWVCGDIKQRRYRKLCLTPTDRKHFLPGDEPLVVAVDDWNLGISICYDLRFPDVFMHLAAGGADAYLVIAHMAGPDPDPGTKAAVIPKLCAIRAAETATPLVFCNTAAADRYCDSGAWDARGMPAPSTAEGFWQTTLQARETLDPWYAGIREDVLKRWRRVGNYPPAIDRRTSKI